MQVILTLLACLVASAPAPSLDGALELYDRGEFAAAGDMYSAVARTSAAADRRAAARRGIAAYRKAFAVGEQPAAASHLCAALALVAAADGPTSLATDLAELRRPFGPCTAAAPAPTAEPELMPVTARREPPVKLLAPPAPEPAPQVAPTRPGRALLGVGVGLVVGGAATLGVTLGAGLSQAAAAAAGADRLTAGAAGRDFTADERQQLHDLHDDLHRGQRTLGAGVGVSAAAMVAGAVLAIVGATRRGSTRLAWIPSGRGLALRLRF